MADRDFVLAPSTSAVKVSIALEPVYNALNSLSLLASHQARSGLGEWIEKTASAMPADLMYRHRLIFYTELGNVCEINAHYPSFPTFLDALAALDPYRLCEQCFVWLYDDDHAWLNPPNRETLLKDKQAYLAVFERLLVKKLEEKPEEKDDMGLFMQLLAEAFDLLQDPPAMQKMIVAHLRQMWHDWLAPEWARVLPMLQESVDAFRQLDYSRMTVLEAIRTVTGRDLSGYPDQWNSEIVFIPSAHLGPYVSWSDENKVTYLLFGARLPEGARATSPALSRSDMLVRLSALADDTRLRILELLTKHDELCAQDVIEMLDLSQSAASRHLRQLTATGYLIERRREVAKCYSLNPQRVDDTLQALKQFLR